MVTAPRRAIVSALDRKLLRDLRAMWVQALAIALVVAAGISVQLLAGGMLSSLEQTRQAYYDRYRFGDVWAPVVRAPQNLAEVLADVDGVQAVETRVAASALFDLEDMAEPATGQILSLPEGREPHVNQIYLTEGRTPEPGRGDEAVVLDSFAAAHDLQVGDTVTVTIRGGRERLRIVGRALSPEYVYAIAPGQLVPDDRLFGVAWMAREALAELVDQKGAFNEASARLMHGASAPAVIAAFDRILEPYGAAGAYGRDDHLSDAFVSSELDQLRTMGQMLPPIFLGVAAFLVNVVIARLIATERSQIGLLKAFGYSNFAVARHYLKLVAAIGLAGAAIGTGLGLWLGRQMALLYADYYRFPFLVFQADPKDYAIAVGVTLAAVCGGAALAVRRAAILPPAEAMTPPPPPDYSRALGARVTGWRVLDQQSRMILRQITRWPARAGFTMIGVAVSGALLIGTLFFIDAMEKMINAYFTISNRYDVAATFVEPRTRKAFYALERAEGVLAAEPFRSVAARLAHGHLVERGALTGAPDDAALSRMIDSAERPVSAPPGGLVLSQDLALKLDVTAGDMLQVRMTEGRRPTLQLQVSRVATTLIGSGAQMRLEDLNRAMDEGPVVSGVYMSIDPEREEGLYAELKAAPLVAGVTLHRLAERNFRELMDRNLGASIWIYTGFAAVIAIGVVYNSARISFAERERELASLRVLGFTRGEVSYILLGEMALLTLLALPVAGLAGTGLARFFAWAMSSDLFRLPFVIDAQTYGYAAVVVIAVTAVTSLIVRRSLDRMDLVGVLKTRD